MNLFSAGSQRGVQPRCVHFAKMRVDALRLADDPHALVLLELRAHLADGEVGGQARLERRRRLEEHARERRAQRSQQRDAGERRRRSPSRSVRRRRGGTTAPRVCALARARLLAFERLLDAALRRRSAAFCSADAGLAMDSGSFQTLVSCTGGVLRLGVVTGGSACGDHAPDCPCTSAMANSTRPDRRKEQHRGQRQDAEQERDADRVGGGCIRLRVRRRRRGRLGSTLRSVPQKLQGVLAKRRPLLGARRR